MSSRVSARTLVSANDRNGHGSQGEAEAPHFQRKSRSGDWAAACSVIGGLPLAKPPLSRQPRSSVRDQAALPHTGRRTAGGEPTMSGSGSCRPGSDLPFRPSADRMAGRRVQGEVDDLNHAQRRSRPPTERGANGRVEAAAIQVGDLRHNGLTTCGRMPGPLG